MVNPYHWTDMPPQLSVIDVRPDLKISNTERGLFFQISLDNYVPALAQLKLANDNTFQAFKLEQIQPNVFLSEKLPHHVVDNIKYVDVELSNKELSRQTRFHYLFTPVVPGSESVAFSNNRNCSVKSLPGSFTKIVLYGLMKSKPLRLLKMDSNYLRYINYNHLI